MRIAFDGEPKPEAGRRPEPPLQVEGGAEETPAPAPDPEPSGGVIGEGARPAGGASGEASREGGMIGEG